MALSIPIEINYMREKGIVQITWDDGHIGDYPQAYLRGYCPCALCQGHGSELKFVEAPEAKVAEITAVGNYAIQMSWADGHNTGIYTFDYLRSLCPCPKCERPGKKPEV